VRHRHDHLAVVLGLLLVAALEGDPGELRDPVDQGGDLLPELLAHLGERRAGVLDRVVQQGRAQRGRVEAHAGADLRHRDGVDDEVLARAPALVGVALAGVDEGALHGLALDPGVARILVFLDDREQIAEQIALELVELDRGGHRLAGGAVHAAVGELHGAAVLPGPAVGAARGGHESSLDPGVAAARPPGAGRGAG